jgi:hypothetical protein
MGIRLEASIHSSLRTVSLGLTIAFFLAGQAISQEAPNHTVVPLHEFQQGQWVEKVWGDFSKPGAQFVFRIHQDAGYIVFPHVHPIDENLTIVKGTWALGMGRRFDRSVLTLMELGSFGIAPKNMAHFGWSKTDTIEQVHGIGPFSSTLLDPVRTHSSGGYSADVALASRHAYHVVPCRLLPSEDGHDGKQRPR